MRPWSVSSRYRPQLGQCLQGLCTGSGAASTSFGDVLVGMGPHNAEFLRRQLQQRLKISTVTDHAITWLTGTKPTGMFISGPNHASHRGRADAVNTGTHDMPFQPPADHHIGITRITP